MLWSGQGSLYTQPLHQPDPGSSAGLVCGGGRAAEEFEEGDPGFPLGRLLTKAPKPGLS